MLCCIVPDIGPADEPFECSGDIGGFQPPVFVIVIVHEMEKRGQGLGAEISRILFSDLPGSDYICLNF